MACNKGARHVSVRNIPITRFTVYCDLTGSIVLYCSTTAIKKLYTMWTFVFDQNLRLIWLLILDCCWSSLGCCKHALRTLFSSLYYKFCLLILNDEVKTLLRHILGLYLVLEAFSFPLESSNPQYNFLSPNL